MDNFEQLNRPQEIIVITTGGTIEKTYDELDGSLENRESIIQKRVLDKLRLPYTRLKIFSLFAKDSLHMTDDDRYLLIQSIKSQLFQNLPIVIIHGTDTMDRSASLTQKKLENLKVPVVFTGAMRPIGFEDSDAIQNFTEALLSVKFLKAGVFISFHNRIFPLPGVKKNKVRGTFEQI